MANVDVLRRTIELAGHEVEQRAISLETDPCIEEDFDVALVGVAACQGLASRYKIGSLWALHRFGSRAGIFPSDGRNVYTFPSSVLTCLSGDHGERTPFEYFLYGQLGKEKPQFVDANLAAAMPGNVFQSVLQRLPHSTTNPKCDWRVLVPTFSWGQSSVYARHFGAPVTTWDPTNIALPMQWDKATLAFDGRLIDVHTALANERERAWVVSSLQDQDPWIKKQKCKWPVIQVGNKRKASKGLGDGYMPEKEMIAKYYTKYWGHLAFGYPLAEGGWWRMRYVHAGMAGIVTCCDEADARRMPEDYRHSRIMLERWSDDKLAEVAHNQWIQLMDVADPSDKAIAAVDGFLKELKG